MKRNNRGKVVQKLFVLRDDYANKSEFERVVRRRVNELRANASLYANGICGDVLVFRNKRGASIIACNPKIEESG